MNRKFNITGQCDPNRHYMVNITDRLQKIEMLIEEGAYFCINRGRQYGKTTTLHALAEHLQTHYRVISLDFQLLSHEDFSNESSFISAFAREVLLSILDKETVPDHIYHRLQEFSQQGDQGLKFALLFGCLSEWCKVSDKPVVLIVDEVDTISNSSVFLDFLSQLRGYFIHRDKRPTFQSVILAGVYDIRSLKSKLRPEEAHRENSPWNIAADFDVEMSFQTVDIASMLQEYESDHNTGMDIAVMSALIYDYTSGYPVLVSRLCMLMDKKGADAWSKEGLLKAVNGILSEDNMLCRSLIKQLYEYPELKEMLHTILFGGISMNYNEDHYVIHMAAMFGFIKNEKGHVMVANRIFETLLYNFFISEEEMKSGMYRAGANDRTMFITDGILNMDLVMERFAVEFHNLYHGEDEKFIEDHGRKFFLLFLKPIINGTGSYYVEARTRDNKRTDIIVNYHGVEYIIEIKIWHGDAYNRRGELQLADYLDIYEAKKGWLLSFNFHKNKVLGRKEISCKDKIIVETVV